MKHATVAWPGALTTFAVLLLSGCGSDRIDPPPDGELAMPEDSEPSPDSLAEWVRRARDGWASGNVAQADTAAVLARLSFSAVWSGLAAETDAARDGAQAEQLPAPLDHALPAPSEVQSRLAAIGLAARIETAAGGTPLWQVVLSDPLGSAGALTEFWAWPDPQAPAGVPVLQPLPQKAPSIARYGPEARGRLFTYGEGKGVGLASAWARPRGRAGLEVALATRASRGTKYDVRSNQVLPVAVDSAEFEAGSPPVLIVRGAGARDPMFDDCPTCPHLERVQRYRHSGSSWTLSEERITNTPYSTFVAFVHAVSAGTPESALPYSAGPAVIEQAMTLGLDRPLSAPLRAAPGTLPEDTTQRYRRSDREPGEAIAVTLEPRAAGWVVSDLRVTRVVIE